MHLKLKTHTFANAHSHISMGPKNIMKIWDSVLYENKTNSVLNLS